jgi:hypothetical protein
MNFILFFFRFEFSLLLEVIATCEEILQDMKAIALILEDSLLNLDGRISHDFIDEVIVSFFLYSYYLSDLIDHFITFIQINNILAMDELKKAENLIWEYEDYTSDYPAVFHGKYVNIVLIFYA